jgi:hypothetical protein
MSVCNACGEEEGRGMRRRASGGSLQGLEENNK